jgi:hypothetical protein
MNEDRLSSLMLWNSAQVYAEAARNLFTYERSKSNWLLIMEPETPLYFLACQAIELSLKGYLRACGESENFLARNCDHSLCRALKAAEKRGLAHLLNLESDERFALDLVNELYVSKALQFTVKGGYTFPHFETVLQLAEKLVSRTERFCLDKVKRHHGEPTAVTALRLRHKAVVN